MLKPATKINSVHLTVQFIKHKDGVIAYAPSLDFSTIGKNLKDSQRMFNEGVSLFLEGLIELGTLSEVLLDLGWVKHNTSWNPPRMISEKSVSIKLPTLVTV